MPIQLKPWQVSPAKEIEKFYSSSNSQGHLLLGNTGCGKTFVIAGGLKLIQDGGRLLPDNDLKPFQLHTILILVPSNAIIQTRRVMIRAGIKGAEVISSSALASSYGENYIEWQSVFNHGDLDVEPIWHCNTMPDLIVADECQFFKNPRSNRTRVLIAYVKAGGKLLLTSATPFQKASECKLIALATGLIRQESEFDSFGWEMSPKDGPTANSPTAVKRIKQALIAQGALTNITGVKYPFKPEIKNWLFTPTPEKKAFIDKAYEVYLEERRKHGKNDPQGVFARWVAMKKFQEACELIKADEIAELGWIVQQKENKAIIFGSNYIATLRKIWHTLVHKLGVNPNEISFLIGNQPAAEKQKNIDDFQEGRTKYFLTTLKSGGTGLNLQHANPKALPRQVILPPTWSVYEMIQVLGRAQRIDNLSAVRQYICWYKGTIEEQVAERLESKFSCLKELIERKDSFIHDVFNKEADEYMKEKFAAEYSSMDEEESGEVDKATVDKSEEKVEEAPQPLGFDLSMLGED